MEASRREKYRSYMRNMDPAGSPRAAQNFYVGRPDSLGMRLARRFDIDSQSSILMVGGIGSGKSTELMASVKELGSTSDVVAIPIDVLGTQRSDKLGPGVLSALVGSQLAKSLSVHEGATADESVEFENAMREIGKIAGGYWDPHGDQYDGGPDDDSGGEWVDGVLFSPTATYPVVGLRKFVEVLLRLSKKKCVYLIDGLDRLQDVTFLNLIAEDVPSLQQAGIGGVVVGPQRVRFGAYSKVKDYFTDMILHGAAVASSPDDFGFLAEILLARDTEKLLTDSAVGRLVHWSGGLVRDLIALARGAGEESYRNGEENIDRPRVDAAADKYGRSLLLGATNEMVARLKTLAPKRGSLSRPGLADFALASELDVSLVTSRFVIEIPSVPIRYILHPTIAALVGGL